ncbi:MAG: DUF3426 domain-containing protein [Betaproteobacteria bacterium]
MRTCCPDCATVFRISAEQLRARNGMVRCGQCRAVFNAFDSLIEDAAPASTGAATPPVRRQIAVSAPTPDPATAAEADGLLPQDAPPGPIPPSITEDAPQSVPEPTSAAHAAPGDHIEKLEVLCQDLERALEAEIPSAPEPTLEVAAQAETLPEPETQPALDPIDAALQSEETPEESARAAREAGLAAVRDLSESPGYDRWAAGTLHLDAAGRIITEPGKRPIWPFVTVVVLLVIALLAQLAYHFRSELTQRLPGLSGAYAALNVAIPLPRQVDLVTIETSDLQSDNARGLLVLQATLKNRAPFAQAWPALELTLTDTNDSVVARRVLTAADYLPPKADPQSFAGASEIGLKLWLESKEAAAGYRLYVFYP